MKLIKKIFGFKLEFSPKELAELVSLFQNQPESFLGKVKDLKTTEKKK